MAGGEAAEVLELAEASLDPVALPVGGGVVRSGDLAGAVGTDPRFGRHVGEKRT